MTTAEEYAHLRLERAVRVWLASFADNHGATRLGDIARMCNALDQLNKARRESVAGRWGEMDEFCEQMRRQ